MKIRNARSPISSEHRIKIPGFARSWSYQLAARSLVSIE